MTASTAQPSTAASLFGDYRPPPGVVDECVTADGQIRHHWRSFADLLSELGRNELQQRWEHAQRQIANEGVIFNPHDLTGSDSRPWVLDAIPSILTESEWRPLEAGLQQRARLWDRMLSDIYGPQQLIRERIIPPELVFGHPLYRPGLVGVHPPNQPALTLYGAELARAPDGRWWVAGDRTRAPLGLGYALENRIVTSRMLPTAFRRLRVERLAPFFLALQDSLRGLTPRFPENPRIVLWSSGPDSHAYFEDAYLARYLGYPLVVGGDLAVRDQRLVLKTLAGLLPVEVLLRRIDDDDCDPLELNSGALHGVPGLLEVVRTGRVAVSNAIGSHLVESPAFLPFLPGICRFLFQEELQLPSVATWWCGQRAALDDVLTRLPHLSIRPAFRTRPTRPTRLSLLSEEQRRDLIDQIKSAPHLFVAQELVDRSTTPTWSAAGPVAWRFALRTFLVQHQQSWHVLPGGLARVARESEELEYTLSAGERSQDVWILSESPVDDVTLLPPAHRPLELRRSGAELASRVADHLLWLGRQTERSEATARLLRTVICSIIEEMDADPVLPALLRVLAEQGQIEPGYVVDVFATPLPAIEQSLPSAIFETTEPRSLRSTINEVLRLASVVRDRLSPDAWHTLHRLDERCRLPAVAPEGLLPELLDLLDRLVLDLSAFSGIVSESMTRTQAWTFLDLGRRLERTWQSCFLLRMTMSRPTTDERPILESLLMTMDSIMTYRTRYLADLQPAPVLDLLLMDESNPRSVAFQLAAIMQHVDSLPQSSGPVIRRPEQQLAFSLLSTVRLADVTTLSHVNSQQERLALHYLLARTGEQALRLSETISQRFLIHAGLPRQLSASQERSH